MLTSECEFPQHSKGNVSLLVLGRESCECMLLRVLAHAYAYGTNTLPHDITKQQEGCQQITDGVTGEGGDVQVLTLKAGHD